MLCQSESCTYLLWVRLRCALPLLMQSSMLSLEGLRCLCGAAFNQLPQGDLLVRSGGVCCAGHLLEHI